MRRFFRFSVTCFVLVSLIFTSLPGVDAGQAQVQADNIVNLAHLDWLHDIVPYPEDPPEGHTTVDPGVPLDAWWTYANYDAETDSYTRIGGGAYDEATNTWSQGAFNLDDVARAAVVYLTHYRYYGDEHSLEMAYGALRFVLYMQTLSGENAGNFVLWMQPDGTLNPTPTPPDSPNPADAGFSWWAARAMWALAEGFATFKDSHPEFASELAARLNLAMEALNRQVLQPAYGTYQDLHGYQVPAWFISDGADASSIALIALARYYEASGDPLAEQLAFQLAEGISQFQLGDPTTWSFQAHLPWAGSISLWHAWGARMVMALATAGRIFDQPAWVTSAEKEANAFLTHELVATGPINGLTPAPTDRVQINFGNEALTNGLLSLAQATGKPSYSILAGLQSSWWFGNNPAGLPMYDPETGRPFDAIEPDGSLNRNAGAESTVTALLGLMNVLQDPIAARYLQHGNIEAILAWQLFEAEAGTPSGPAEVVVPESAWTGEALWSGGAYVALDAGSELSLPVAVPAAGTYRLFFVYDKQLGALEDVAVDVRIDRGRLVRHYQGGAAPPGDSPNSSYLWMDSLELPGQISAGEHTLTLTGVSGEARIDAVLLQPVVEHRAVSDDSGHTVILLKSFSENLNPTKVAVPDELVFVRIFNLEGQLVREGRQRAANGEILLRIPPYGYAVVEGGR